MPFDDDINHVRELFRSTVDVADVDPPNMEFRIVRQMVWQDRPDVIYVTDSKPIALQELKPITEYNAQAYGNHVRVWLEQRSVGEWKESE